MRISLPSLVLPIVGGVASAALVGIGAWDALKPAILPAVSIIAAAVLVRLARGLPFTNADHFTLEQFRGVSANLLANARKLRALIFVCLLAIVVLVLGKDFVEVVGNLTAKWPDIKSVVAVITSGLIGVLLTYSFARVIEVVHSDVALLRLQSNIIETAITKKNADTFQKAIAAEKAPGIAGASSFGSRLPS